MTAPPAVRFARVLALGGYAALLGVIVLWHAWLAPPTVLSPPLVVAVLVLPLLCGLPGMLRGRRYTHAWLSLAAPVYFVIGVDGMAAAVEPDWLGPAMVTASVGLFIGAVVYVRASRSGSIGQQDESA